MNKSELVAAVSAHTATDPKVVARVLDGIEDVVVATVRKGSEKVSWTGFLGFEQVARKARRGRNPRTGETIRVRAKKAPHVTVGAAFKKVVTGESPAPKLVAVKASKAASPAKPPTATKQVAAATKTATARSRATISAGHRPAKAGAAKRPGKRVTKA